MLEFWRRSAKENFRAAGETKRRECKKEGLWTKTKKRRRKIILKVVENQIRDNDPPETRKTLKRLIKEGFSREEAVELIGTVVVHEIYDVLKQHEYFDRQRFVAALSQLPKLPYEEDS